MQSVELQARIMGLVHGATTLRPRRPAGANGADDFDPSARHMEFLYSLEREEDTLAAT